MLKTNRLRANWFVLAFCTVALLSQNLRAQFFTFTGTNQPGTAQNFVITVTPGTTNLAINVGGGATAFSHLLLKAGAPPSDTDYDFLAAQNNQGNAINLEPPEFRVTNFTVRVRTPSNSLAHSFTVTINTNTTDFRTSARPATKSIISTNQGSLTGASAWHYFRVEIPTNVPGWRVQLSSTNNGPDLYIQRGALPTTLSNLKRSQTQTNDDLAFAGNEATPGAYYIGVLLPSGSAAYTLRTELISFTTLTWDPGTTHLGTQVYTHNNTNGGDYWFKITTQNTALGAWRTALNISTGEANIYLAKGTPPSVANNLYKSERGGADGFVVPSTAFSAGEDWYYLVHANPGAQWTLVTGEPFVTDLGVVAADASSSSGNVTLGAEGLRFFKTSLPVNAVAWRLWLNGLTNTVLVRKTGVPLPAAGGSDLSQAGQMLVVPSYLVGGQLYFVGVSGAPGTAINLDSRLQSFVDLPFVSSTNLTLAGYGYTTFRVQVPFDQLAWQTSVVVSNGNPNLAVRRNFIPNEFNNDAYSEVASNVTDSITLVPPTLSDGTFFITVYSASNFSCTLQSGNPEITEINFNSATLNTDTNRVGWRFFKVSNISQQLGALGWDLFVTNFNPGTRLALRRNAAPGIWNFRNPNPGTAGSYDFLSAADFLQRPGHQADVWYVGVFTTNAPLGAFTLVTRELTAEPLTFDGGFLTRVSVPAGKWQYFQMDIPTNILGWDLRLTNVTSGSPTLVVRRELLPAFIGGFTLPVTATNWPTGNNWSAGPDWTARNLSPDGNVNENGRVLTMGYGRPLEGGTYYIGVISPAGATNAMSYTVLSRGIGPGQAIPVQDIDYAGGSATNGALGPRDIAVYRVNIVTNTPSWKVRLAITDGDAVLAVAKDRIPNISAEAIGGVTNVQTAGKKMLRAGNEHFVQLPGPGRTELFPGLYYLVVASEGIVGTNAARIGTGDASYLLQSVGPMPEIDLGLLNINDIVYTGQLEGGESAAFHFQNHPFPTTLGFELSLEATVGNPAMVSRGDLDLANPGASSAGGGGAAVPADPYGNDGGQGNALQASTDIITVADPFETETVMVKARGSVGDYPDALYTLRIRKLVPSPLAFNGGLATVFNQTNAYGFFRIDVPEDALGWDLRLTNVLTGSPILIASRDFLPLNFVTAGWNPGIATNWPPGANWIAAKDWTQRSFSSDGTVNEDGRILAMGLGRPLEAGTYYVGVYNPDAPLPLDYKISSRGIGGTNLIPVVDLPFVGGVVTNTAVPPREAAYYRVIVPDDAKSFQVKHTALTGESMLLLLTNSVPSVLSGRPSNAGKFMHKTGNEHYLRVPILPDTILTPGTNYLAVVSEGLAPTDATRVGIGKSSFALESIGEMPVIDLGTVGDTNLTHSATLEGGQVRAYRFTVPAGLTNLEAQLQTSNGSPAMVLRWGEEFPNPGAASIGQGAGTVILDDYGNEGGHLISSGNGNANTNLISLANPVDGVYTLLVKARASSPGVYPNANYTLVVRSTTPSITFTTVNFDGGADIVTNQIANSWRYFRVDVPTNALGWDIRLANVIAGAPKLVVRRDMVPTSLLTGPWSSAGIQTSWPTTNQWAAGADWTRRPTAADGVTSEDGRILAMGMGQPLEAGTYYIGVINSVGNTNMSYTLLSRGVGNGLSLPVVDLNYQGGSAAVSNLAPREAAYFRILVPANSPGFKIKLTPSVGEVMLVVLSNHVPNIDSGRLTGPLTGKFMQKAGDEHYLVLPLAGSSNLIAGPYYLAVVGEGINPASAQRIGSGSSAFVINSVGNVPVNNLGTVGAVDLVVTNSLEGGESQIYQFTIPPALPAVEMRLENRVGNPVMVVLTNSTLPDPGGVSSLKDTYGNDGGAIPTDINTNILTVANPSNGVFTLAVKARAAGTVYPDAAYTLRVRAMPAPELNFTAALNTNGLSNLGAGLLLDSQRAYYKVVVPTIVNGQPVIGWELNLSQSAGQAGLRVRKDALPVDGLPGIPYTANAAIIAPPVLTPGTWFVEVRGTNSTAYTLTSSALALQRPAWLMPGLGEASTTPGLSAPDFGDSGVETNGVLLPDDHGIDLELGRYHYYAAIVPTNNGGLLHVQLEGISGNPDFYLRMGQVPTSSHNTNGLAGTSFERSLTGTTTEYGNFVPLNGNFETRLQAGTWYFAVRAVANANARYRLKLSTGVVQDLALNGGATNNQNVAGTDWRYYRVQIPVDAPTNWHITFSQELGDVVMHVRDTVPPGNGATTNLSEYKDWTSDAKNAGPYGNFDLAGTYTFSIPPVRPNSVYYLGFRGKSDAIFSVSSSTSGSTVSVPPVIPFYGGAVSNLIPANSQVAYRILTPADSLRWRHTSVHASTVGVYIENGTFPAKSVNDDFRSQVANSSLDRFLVTPPWLTNQTYYMIVTNTTASAQVFTFNMNGSSITADDDLDGLPDVWEIQYFGNLNQQPGNDFDLDGVSNRDEYIEGTNPADKNSLRPRLTVVAVNGVVTINPPGTNYTQGTVVTLGASPNAGYDFVGWSGAAGGNANPLLVTMNTNKSITARFRVPGDDFDQRIALIGSTVTHSGLQNTSATKELGEPNHAGNVGGKSLWWTWTAPNSGTVTLTTAGSTFRNALAVYSGSSVTNLAGVAANLPGVGTNTSQVAFAAVANAIYQIAVDGFNGAAGSVVVNLSIPGAPVPLIIASPVRLADGQFQFTVIGPTNQVLHIEAATNLTSWTTLAAFTNTSGTIPYIDSSATNFSRRFYRAVAP